MHRLLNGHVQRFVPILIYNRLRDLRVCDGALLAWCDGLLLLLMVHGCEGVDFCSSDSCSSCMPEHQQAACLLLLNDVGYYSQMLLPCALADSLA